MPRKIVRTDNVVNRIPQSDKRAGRFFDEDFRQNAKPVAHTAKWGNPAPETLPDKRFSACVAKASDGTVFPAATSPGKARGGLPDFPDIFSPFRKRFPDIGKRANPFLSEPVNLY